MRERERKKKERKKKKRKTYRPNFSRRSIKVVLLKMRSSGVRKLRVFVVGVINIIC